MAISLAAAPESWAAKNNATLRIDRMLTMLTVGNDPEHLALKPDGGEIFVSNYGANSISEISTSTNEVGGTYTIADHPGHAIVSSDNSTLWIANVAADSLGIYSIDDGRLVGGTRTGAGPDALAFSADEHLLLAAGPGRVGQRVDVEVKGVTLLAPGRAGLVVGPVRHHDLDEVVVGVLGPLGLCGRVLRHDLSFLFWHAGGERRRRRPARDAEGVSGCTEP